MPDAFSQGTCFVVRPAVPEDAQAIHDIYQYYVDHTVATFSTQTASVASYAEHIAHTPYPYLVAVEISGENGKEQVVGFAYADRLRPHNAYQWDVELTVYLHPDAPKRSGVGKTLYDQLLPLLASQGFLNAYGIITAANTGSLAFHQRAGFVEVARFPRMGYKHGAWHDVVWMHKALGGFPSQPQPPLPLRT